MIGQCVTDYYLLKYRNLEHNDVAR